MPLKMNYLDSWRFLLPPDQQDYDCEIVWRMGGGKTETTARFTTDETLLFVDELPKSKGGKILDKILNR